jgi:hypothetical protein
VKKFPVALGTEPHKSAFLLIVSIPMEAGMSRSDELKKIADNCADMAQAAKDLPKKNRLERLADGWNTLAQSQAWLDGETDDPGPKAA